MEHFWKSSCIYVSEQVKLPWNQVCKYEKSQSSGKKVLIWVFKYYNFLEQR